VQVEVYTGSRPGTAAGGRPTVLSFEQAAALNGGRLPLGVVPQGGSAAAGSVRVQYADTDELTVWVEPGTGRVLDLKWTETVRATLVGTQVGAVPLDSPVVSGSQAFPAATVAVAAAAARHDLQRVTDRSNLLTVLWLAVVVAVAALVAAGLTAAAARQQREAKPVHTPLPTAG
jgi:high-affinity iron transporter